MYLIHLLDIQECLIIHYVSIPRSITTVIAVEKRSLPVYEACLAILWSPPIIGYPLVLLSLCLKSLLKLIQVVPLPVVVSLLMITLLFHVAPTVCPLLLVSVLTVFVSLPLLVQVLFLFHYVLRMLAIRSVMIPVGLIPVQRSPPLTRSMPL